MKILQVMAGAPTGGAETAFIDTCIALFESGAEIEVATRYNPRNDTLIDRGIKVHELAFGGFTDFQTKRYLKRIIAGFKPQIVQTWMSRAAAKTPISPKPKTYLNVARLGGYYDIKYFKSADYFITITPDIKNHLMKNGVAENRIRHINNLAETEKNFVPVTRRELDTPDDAVVLLTLSRLHVSKGLDTLMQAIADQPKFYLWMAGDGPLLTELQDLAARLGITERVKFLGWRSDRAALLNACDICVFPSRYEPFGSVFIQAWAHRVPLITSNASGPSQFVRDREDGLVFNIDDVEGLKAALIELSSDEQLQAKLIGNGAIRYQNEFTREKTIAAYFDYFTEILARESVTR